MAIAGRNTRASNRENSRATFQPCGSFDQMMEQRQRQKQRHYTGLAELQSGHLFAALIDGNDLRRLRLKGLIYRPAGTNRYFKVIWLDV